MVWLPTRLLAVWARFRLRHTFPTYTRLMAIVSTMSLAGLAEWLHSNGTGHAYRATLGFVGDIATSNKHELSEYLAQEPRSTGDRRSDALLAAVAEYLAFEREVATPGWCLQPERFLATAWFPVDLPSIRVRALVSSPAAFWRRLIFIDRSDLVRV